MGGAFRARVRHGLLEPVEKVDLPEGKEVTVTILDVPSEPDVEAFRRSFGGWKDTVDANALIQSIRESRLISTRPTPRL
jgi:predicted DNA-binding antitoxin AbrB/MazE fold protein